MIIKTHILTQHQIRQIRDIERECGIKRPIITANMYNFHRDMDCYFMFISDDITAGVLFIENTESGIAEIKIDVRPPFRRRGIAGKLADAALRECRAFGIEDIRFVCEDGQSDGLAAVAKRGMQPVGCDLLLEYAASADVGEVPCAYGMRRVDEDHRQAMCAQSSAAFGDDIETSRSIFAGVFENPNAQAYASFDKDALIASCCCEASDCGWHLFALSVLPEYQGRGVGKSLLLHVLREIAGDGRDITIGVDPDNAPAVRMYTALGFKQKVRYAFYK